MYSDDLFHEPLLLFSTYFWAMDEAPASGFNRELGIEFRQRLEQLDFTLRRIRDIELRAADEWRKLASRDSHSTLSQSTSAKEGFGHEDDLVFELQLMVEAFYYFAGRARSLARSKHHPLPGLQFFEAAGVRDVRNQLIEHPEGNSDRLFTPSMVWGGPAGPAIKRAHAPGQNVVFTDRGIYWNAKQFCDRLVSVLETAIRAAGV